MSRSYRKPWDIRTAYIRFWSENLRGDNRHRWEDNIHVDLSGTGRTFVELITFAQHRGFWENGNKILDSTKSGNI